MANFNLTITNEGAAFLANVIANQGSLDFTEVRFSSTNYVGSEATLTEGTFGGAFITAVPSASVADLTTINVESSFDNSSFTTDKTLYSIGVIAEDGDGNVALVAVCTTSTPDTIPKFVSVASTFACNINLTVSDTQNITVTASGAGVVFVTDIVDDLNSSATNKPLSANQGRVLKKMLSNRNLLMNPWFTVNQRGWTSGALVSNQYCVDRWKMHSMSGAATIAATSSGLNVTLDAISARPIIIQVVENPSYFVGKRFTFSAKVIIGGVEKIVHGTETVPSGNTRTAFYSDTNVVLSYFGDLSAFVCEVTQFSNTATIVALKVEKGESSTLANDTPPDYSTELLKCQRYFVRLSGSANIPLTHGYVRSATEGKAFVDMTVPMRNSPTVTYGGSIEYYESINSSHAISGISLNGVTSRIIQLSVTTTGLTAGGLGFLRTGDGTGYVDLSAEL